MRFSTHWQTLTLLFCLLQVALFAQSSLPGQMRQRYPDQKAVYLKKSRKIVIQQKNRELLVTAHHYAEMLHLQNMSGAYADEAIPFSQFNEILSIDARTLVPLAANKYKTLKVENFVTQNVLSGAVFFDDYKEKTFVFPGVVPGAHTILEYSERLKEARLLGAYHFNAHLPVEESELVVEAPEEVRLNFKLFGCDSLHIQSSQQKKGQNIVYSWKVLHPPVFNDEEDIARSTYTEPHIVPYIEEIQGPGQPQRLLKDVSDLYRWYYSLVKSVKGSPGPLLRQLTDSLTQSLVSPEEKAKAIYYWVQDNIKYIAFEDGMEGLIPRDPSQVCSKRYGDCKDMSQLLVTMLNIAGIPAHLTWIGTRTLPYSYQELPTPMVDNHMIATAFIAGKPCFLDATGSYQPFGLPTSMIQGKQALVGLDEQRFELLEVPVAAAAHSRLSDTCRLQLDETLLSGSGQAEFTGFQKIEARYELAGKNEKDKKEAAADLLRKGNNKFLLQELTCENTEEKEKALRLRYSFRLENYAKKAANELYVNLHLARNYQNEFIESDKRRAGIENSHRFEKNFVSILELPRGYQLKYLPDSSGFTDELFGFSIRYAFDGKNIVMTQRLYVNYLQLNRSDFDRWNQMIRAINKAYRETVTLRK